MKTKLAAVLVSAITLTVGPALAEGEATTTTTTTATATAAPAEGGGEKGGEKEFGNPGVIGIGGAVNFGAFATGANSSAETRSPTGLELAIGSSKPKEGESTSTFAFSIAPTLDYFVIEGFSVGAQLGFGMSSEKKGEEKQSTTVIGVGPRVGYNLWLTPEKLSLYPQLTFNYAMFSKKAGDVDGASGNKMGIRVFVPVLIHPAKHFHFGVGPFFHMDLSSKFKDPVLTKGESVDGPKDTIFGLSLEIGGWL